MSRRKTRSDKGKPRVYDNTLRRAKSIDKHRDHVVKVRQPGRPRHVRRAENRAAKLPEDMRCPECGELKIRSRQWVVKGLRVCCRSCYHRND